jgi:hypothetical protein
MLKEAAVVGGRGSLSRSYWKDQEYPPRGWLALFGNHPDGDAPPPPKPAPLSPPEFTPVGHEPPSVGHEPQLGGVPVGNSVGNCRGRFIGFDFVGRGCDALL